MKIKRLFFPSALLLLAALFVFGQFFLRSRRPAASPALAESAFAALGALRSIAVEIVWFRADRLQDEGRYVELAQLASLLTSLEPHTPEVWSYSAWNLAYNISVMMPTSEDRWRWVDSAIGLLRDEGLAINPGDPELCRELAWLFEMKLGTSIDSSSDYYREKWSERVADVSRRDAWDELGMTAAKMRRVEGETGFDDWRDPRLHAIYWAAEGLPAATGKDRSMLAETIRQSVMLYRKAHAGPRVGPRVERQSK